MADILADAGALLAAARRAASCYGDSPSMERAAATWVSASPVAKGLLIEYQEARAALVAARQPLPVYPGAAPTDGERELARSEWQPDPDGPGVRRWNAGGYVRCPGVGGDGAFNGRWIPGPGSAAELVAARATVAAYQAWYDGEFTAARATQAEQLRPLTERYDAAEMACYEAISVFAEGGR